MGTAIRAGLGADTLPRPLIWVTDARPGIQRLRRGKGFSYVRPDGRVVADAATLVRIRRIVIPPAWREVWICPAPNGHIQATGRDQRGRKQYRYHHQWRAHRDETKFQLLPEFGAALPSIRRRLARDLATPGLAREKVLAAIVRLLESTLIRVGNDEYTRLNGSYGLTTLLDRHVTFSRATVRFRFRGKSGVDRNVTLEDRELARIVKRAQELPGQTLFQYVAEDGRRRRVTSGDVNDYLRQISGREFTAKLFRTWGGTLSVLCALSRRPPPETAREAKTAVLEAIRAAAHELGNTVSVCRKYYVHPAVIEAYEAGRLKPFSGCGERRKTKSLGLGRDERELLKLLAARSSRSNGKIRGL